MVSDNTVNDNSINCASAATNYAVDNPSVNVSSSHCENTNIENSVDNSPVFMAHSISESSPIIRSAHKIAIAGLGLIGGSIARRLVEHHRYVTAWNHNPRPYAQATEAGITCVDTLQKLIEGKPDIVILAVPLRVMESTLREIRQWIHPTTTVIDVGSVKEDVHQAVHNADMQEYYVGAHPMAGNECSGFEASSSKIFDGALWALTYDDTTQFQRVTTVLDMITVGLDNRAIVLDAVTHDTAAALISHMPHVVATALANQLVDSPIANIAQALSAGSWRDMTRVALTSPERTRAMVEKDPHAASIVRAVAQSLLDIADSLDECAGNSTEQEISHSDCETAIAEFFHHADTYRAYKQLQKENLHDNCSITMANSLDENKQILDITDNHWREQLTDNALQGYIIERLVTPYRLQVYNQALVP